MIIEDMLIRSLHETLQKKKEASTKQHCGNRYKTEGMLILLTYTTIETSLSTYMLYFSGNNVEIK